MRTFVKCAPGIFLTFFSVFALAQTRSVQPQSEVVPPQQRSAVVSAYGRLPLSFEPNPGQGGAAASFVARGQGYTLLLNPNATTLALQRPHPRRGRDHIERGVMGRGTPPAALQLRLVGASGSAEAAAEGLLAGKSNYLIGNDRTKWRTNVANYARVRYRGVYPGIDVVYYGNQRLLEHDFEVAPGGDPSKIRLAFEGTTSAEIDASGDLVLHVADGEVRLHKPLMYQPTPQGKREIAGGFVLRGREVSFNVGEYDRGKTLVIDPTLSYATYLGGNGEDIASAIAVDTAGNAYLVGQTTSTNFPLVSAISSVCNNCGGSSDDVFVTKISPAGSGGTGGTALVYSTYLGGSNDDEGYGIAVNSGGIAYITGFTNSANFPTANADQPTLASPMGNGFVAALDAPGSPLLFSTFIGGSVRDFGNAITVDSSGNVLVGGIAYSRDFPLRLNLPLSVPAVFYASANSGTSFTSSAAGLPALEINAIVVDANTPGTLYLGASGGGVYKSTDSGATWSATTLNDYVQALAMDPTASLTGPTGVIYAGSRFFGVRKSIDGGATWTTINAGLVDSGGAPVSDVTALLASPSNPAVVYAGTRSNGVYVSNNANSASPTWAPLNSGLTNLRVRSLAFNYNNGSVYAGSSAGVFQLASGQTSWSQVGSFSGLVLGLAVDGSSNLFVANPRNMWKYSGGTWAIAPGGALGSRYLQAVVFDGCSATLYAAGPSGFFRSFDDGGSWAQVSSGITSNNIRAIAVDGQCAGGHVYVGGSNSMTFLAKYSATGTASVRSLFGGQSGYTWTNAIATDGTSSGNVFIAGVTSTPGLPSASNGLSGTPGFVTKLNMSATPAVVWSRYVGGSYEQQILGMAVDVTGNVYVTGYTNSADFPVTAASAGPPATVGAFQPALKGLTGQDQDAFLTKIDATGTSLLYSTFFGGSKNDTGFGLALDVNGLVSIAGYTSSADLPTANAYQPYSGGGSDAFYSRFDTSQNGAASLRYSTYLGGADEDFAYGLAVDSNGGAYIAGETYSLNFPVTGNAVQSGSSGLDDAFLVKFQSSTNTTDLSATMTPSLTTVAAGQSYDYTITVTNNGPSSTGGNNVRIYDALPPNLTLVSALGSFSTGGSFFCSGSGPGARVQCNLGQLPYLSSATLTLTVTASVTAPATSVSVINTVFASSDDEDPTPTNNSASAAVTVQVLADLAITNLSGPAPAFRGTSFHYSVTIQNFGPSNATGVVLSYPLPAGVTFNQANSSSFCSQAGGNVTCSGDMPSGASVPLTIEVMANTAGTLNSTFTISSANVIDNVPGNNSVTVNTTVMPNIELSLGVTTAAPLAPVGGSAAFVLTISNHGSDTAPSVSARITLPQGLSYLTFSSPSAGVNCGLDGDVYCGLSNLASQGSVTITIFATSAVQGYYRATVSVTPSSDLDPSNNNGSAAVTFNGGVSSQLTTLLTDYETSTVQGYSTMPGGGQVTQPILAGGSPSNVALAPNGRLAFVANVNGGYISVVDLTIQAEITRIWNVGSWSLAMSSDGAKLVAVGYDRDELDIIDVATLAVTRISLDDWVGDVAGKADIHPFSVALAGYRAYIVNEFGPVIAVDFTAPTSPTISTVANTAGMVQRHNGHAVGTTPDGNTVVVFGLPTGSTSAVVYLIANSTTPVLSQTVNTTIGNPRTVAITPNPNAGSGVLAFLGRGGGFIDTLDLRPGSGTYGQILAGATVSVGSVGVQDLAFTPDGTTLQAVVGTAQGANSPASTLVTLNPAQMVSSPSSAILSNVPIPNSISARGIAIGYVQSSPLTSAPRITEVSPAQITNEAAKTVTIFGDNFATGAQVRIGNLAPLAATFVSSHQLTVAVPAGAAVQKGTIVVTLPNSSGGALDANVSGGGPQNFVSLQIDPPPSFSPAHPVVVGSFGTENFSVLFRDSTLVPGGPFASSLALSPDGRYALSNTWQLSVADLDAPQLRTIPIFSSNTSGSGVTGGAAGDGIGVALHQPSGKQAAFMVGCDAATCSSDTLYIVDVDTNSTNRFAVLDTIQATPTDFYQAQGLAVTPDGSYVYSVDTSAFSGTAITAARLVIFNVAARNSTVIPDISTLGVDVNQYHIAITPDGSYLLLSGPGGTSIKVYDIRGANALSPAPVAPDFTGSGAPKTPAFGWFQVVGTASPHFYAYDSAQRFVQVFDFNSRTPLGSYTIPSAPGAIAGSAMTVTPEGTLLYALVENEDAVAVLDTNVLASGAGNPLISKMRTAVLPSMVAVSSRSNVSADLAADISYAVDYFYANAAAVNQPFDIHIGVTNLGPSSGTGVTMTLVIPSGVQANTAFITDSSGVANFTCAVSSTEVACPVGTLRASDFVTVHVNVTAAAVGSYTFTNTVGPIGSDPNPTNNVASLVMNVQNGADLSVTMSASPNPAPTDQPVTLTAVVTNNGPDTATAVTASASFPFASPPVVTTTQGTCTTETGSCSLGDIPSGASVTITATGPINPFSISASGTLPGFGSAYGTSADPNLSNNFVNLNVPLASPSDAATRYLVTDRGVGQLRIYDPTTHLPLGQPSQVGVSAISTALSPNRRLAFTANLNANYISVSDLSIQTEIYRMRGLRAGTIGITAEGTRLVAPLYGSDSVAILDAATFQVLQTLNLNGLVGDDPTSTSDILWGGMVMAGSKAYIDLTTVAGATNPIVVIDAAAAPAASPVLVTGIAGTGANFPGITDIAATPDGLDVLAVRTTSGCTNNCPVQIISTASNSVTGQVSAGAGVLQVSSASRIAISPSNPNGVFGYLSYGRLLRAIDLRPGSSTFGQIMSGAQAVLPFPPMYLTVSGDGTRVYATTTSFTEQYDFAIIDTNLLRSGTTGAVMMTRRLSQAGLRAVVEGPIDALPSVAAPQITDVQPAFFFNDVDTTVTISGSGFAPDARVKIGSLDPIAATPISSNQIQVTVPAGAATQRGSVVVTNPNTTGPVAQQWLSGILRHSHGTSSDTAIESITPVSYQPKFDVFASNFGDGTIARLGHNHDTSVVPAPMGLAFTPDGSQFFTESFYVPEAAVGTLTGPPTLIAFDPSAGQGQAGQAEGIAIPSGSGAPLVAYAASAVRDPNSLIYGEKLNIIDANPFSPSFKTIIDTITAAGLDTSAGRGALAVTPNGRYVYEHAYPASTTLGLLVIFDTVSRTATAIGTDGLGVASSQAKIVVTNDGHWLLLQDVSGSVKVFDISSTPLSPTPLPGNPVVAADTPSGMTAPQFNSFAVAGSHLYAYDGTQNLLEVFNFNPGSGNLSHIRSFVLPGNKFDFYAGVAIAPDESFVYAAQPADDAVAVVDGSKLLSGDPAPLVTRIGSGVAPEVVAISPKRLDTAAMNMGITINHSPTSVALGGDITFDIRLTNDGPFSGSGSDSGGGFLITFDKSLSFGSSTFQNSPFVDCSLRGNQLLCGFTQNGPDLGPPPVHIDGNLVLHTTATGTVSVTGYVDGGAYDPNPGNNTATEFVDVITPVDLLVSAGVSSQLSFDSLASSLTNYAYIPSNYGSTPQVTVSYATEGLGTGGTDFPNLSWWGAGYGDLASAAFSAGNGYFADIFLTATSAPITLTSFDFAGWPQTDKANQTLQVYADGNLVNDYSPATALGAGPAHSHITASATGNVIRIRWGTDWNVGVNNVSFTTDAPTNVLLGANVTFNPTIFNGSSSFTATGVSLSYTVPAGLTLVSANSTSMSCSGSTTVTCTQTSLAPNAAASAAITVHPTATGSMLNTVSVTGNEVDPNSGNNSTSFNLQVTPSADLGVSMTASPATLAPNTNLTYTIVVSNSGPSQSTGFSLTDTLPAGVTFVSASTGCTATSEGSTWVTCTGPALAVGQSATFVIVVTPSSEATLVNTAGVVGNEADVAPSNNSATVQNFAIAADIAVVAGSAPTLAGGLPAYSVTVTNNGPSSASGVVLTDAMDNYGLVSYTTTQGSCSYASPTLTCDLGDLAVGGSVVVTVVVTAPSQGWAANSFHATATQPDPNPVNNAVRIGPSADGFNTPAGNNVAVAATDAADGLAAAVIFSNVTRSGTTSMSPLSVANLPAGFRTGRQPTVFDISSNAVFNGAITLNIRFAPANFRHPALVRLFHYESGGWVDRTAALDPVAGAVAGRVLSLSPFALLEPLDTTPVANPGSDRTIPGAMAAGARVALDGAASYDAEGDLLTYRWTGPFPEGGGMVTGVNATVTLPLGVSRVSLVVNDGEVDSPAVAVNIAVADFQLSAPAAAVTLARGQSTSFTITATPQYGAFAAPVNLTCAPASADVTCSFSTASIFPGAGAASATLTVTAASAMARIPSGSVPRQLALWFGTLPLFGMVFLAAGRRRKVHGAPHRPGFGKCGWLALLALLILLATHVGCGGGGTTQTQSSSPTTPGARSVTVTVTGTSGTLQRASSVMVTIAQ